MAQNFNLGALGQILTVNTAANSASYSGTVNAAAHTIGTTWVANTSGVYMSMPLTANGGTGTSGQYLTSNGSTGAPYWSTVTNYTISTGLVNTSGTVTVNAAYINTISSNNAAYLGGTAAASYALLAGPTFTGTVNVSSGSLNSNNLLLQGDGTNAYIRPTNSGSNLYLGSNNTNQLTISAAGLFGINNSAPVAAFTMSDKTPNPTFHITGSNSSYNAVFAGTTYGVESGIQFRRSNGTSAVPLAVGANDRLGYMIGASSSDGTTFYNTTAINFYSESTTNSTSQPSYITFATTATGAVSRSEAMRISGNGNIGIGNSAPTDKLSINGTTYHQGNVVLGSSSIAVGLQANGSYGTAGQLLTSNGSAIYWSTVAGGGGYYAKGGSATVGSASDANNIFRVNGQTLYNNTTIGATENAQCAGPLTINTGILLTITTGGRVVIS